jgi:hypothetical protein
VIILTTEKQVEKGIAEIVGALRDPIIVYPGGWGDTLPEWLKNSITLERLAMNMKAFKGEEMTGTDAEAVAYLMTASLTAPMDHDWGQIYLYVATQTYQRWGKNEMPADIAVDKLDNEQMRDLQRLKAWIYRTRSRVRADRERAERNKTKVKRYQAERQEPQEHETASQEILQPSLFDF